MCPAAYAPIAQMVGATAAIDCQDRRATDDCRTNQTRSLVEPDVYRHILDDLPHGVGWERLPSNAAT